MSAVSRYRVAIDIGGTFTDAVLVDTVSGALWFGKSLTTPADPNDGAVAAFERVVADAGATGEEVFGCVHGTTLVINTLIERKGATVALFTTEGFRDVLEIKRESTYDIRDLFAPHPAPLVPRDWCHDTGERTDVSGTVVREVDAERLADSLAQLERRGVESVAIAFLHAHREPANELAAAAVVAERLPGIPVSLSHQVAPEIREYERTVTTAASAYVKPIAQRYLPQLEQRLQSSGMDGDLTLMTSTGGVTAVEAALERPIGLVESGPAGGAFVAGFLGDLAQVESVLAFDMGGTTAKGAIVEHGRPMIAFELEVARAARMRQGSGILLRVPSVELIEIGAGGGSIAGTDALGLLQVGPRSAGAVPGPACYGLGGTQPTVTDAAVILGYIGTESFLGGEMALDRAASEEAMRTAVAEPLGADVVTSAYAVHDLVVEQMASAVRTHLAEHGRDHRRFTLVATGGAGPVHVYSLARRLGIGRVVIGAGTGVASALGLLVAPPQAERVRGRYMSLADPDPEAIAELFAAMSEEIVAELDGLGVERSAIAWEVIGEFRYEGQGSQVPTRLAGAEVDALSAATLRSAFETTYEALYGRTLRGVEVEGVSWRLRGTGPAGGADVVAAALRSGRTPAGDVDPRKGSRDVYFAATDGFVETPVLDRYALPTGFVARGPLIVEERESTIVVGPDAQLSVDEHGSVVIELDSAT